MIIYLRHRLRMKYFACIILTVTLTESYGFSKNIKKEPIYSNTWIIEVKDGQEAARKLSDELLLQYHGPVGSLENLHIVQHKNVARNSNMAADKHHKIISSHHKVSHAVQQKVLSRKKRGPSRKQDIARNRRDDPLFLNQWYLKNNGQTKGICTERHDINVYPVWSRGITGKGVVVAILDDGLEHTHPDLKKNFLASASYDFNTPSEDPIPRYTYDNINQHGTRCAGEVAAERGNGYCGRGVAYNANISGIRMLDGDVTDAIEAGSLTYKKDIIDIYSSSWGPDDDGVTVDGPGKYTKRAFKIGAEKGRNGLGSIFVWATGNGGGSYDYCSCDGYINSPYTIAIGAVDNCGRKPWYSELCPGTFAVTYSSGSAMDLQIVTTDLRHTCTKSHTGTSAAAPLAAGMFALVLEANNNLTWRDLQHLIVQTSKIISPTDIDWQVNGAGHSVNAKFGFGVLDTDALVKAATKKDWKTSPPRSEYTSFRKTVRLRSIRLYQNVVKSTITIDDSQHCIKKLEHVHVVVTLRLPYSYFRRGQRGQHSITLESPSGTISEILRQRPRDAMQGDAFKDWEFLTLFHWDESPNGDWILTVTDHSNAPWMSKHELSWKLKISGTC